MNGGRATDVTVGVLGLQGDVAEHEEVLRDLGARVRRVRLPADLEGISALVIPGGESTTLSMLLDSSELRAPIAKLLETGLPALGTCAGMILLARDVLDGRPDQTSFGALDIAVRRNAFGRQLESFEADLDVTGVEGGPMHAVFIRAPVVETVGPDVEVLASVTWPDGTTRPVVCRQGAVTVAAFHPELAGEERLHELLLRDVAGTTRRRRAFDQVGGRAMKIKELGHVVLYVRNLERSVHFYRDVLGFHAIERSDGGPLRGAMAFSSGRTHHELLLIEVGEDAPHPGMGRRAGLYHIGFKVGDTDDELRDAIRTVAEAGVRVVGASDHTVTHSLYILDPDDNEIELYIDVPDLDWDDPAAVLAPVKPLRI